MLITNLLRAASSRERFEVLKAPLYKSDTSILRTDQTSSTYHQSIDITVAFQQIPSSGLVLPIMANLNLGSCQCGNFLFNEGFSRVPNG